MDRSSVIPVWERIVRETTCAQIISGPDTGHVWNLVIDGVYPRETAFAAVVFAVEWKRTGDVQFRNRSLACLNCVEALLARSPKGTLDEPYVTARGVRQRKGSIPATILLLEAARRAASIMEYPFVFDGEAVEVYLSRCYCGNGRFSHDEIPDRKSEHLHVVNTTAMAFYHLASMRKNGALAGGMDLGQMRGALVASMRRDGFSPYHECRTWQRCFFRCSRLIPGKLIQWHKAIMGDRSIFFGDMVHHCITWYYFARGLIEGEIAPTAQETKCLWTGWQFMERKCRTDKDGGVRLDFSWEPVPQFYRHCNFIDTTSYFYAIDFLRVLGALNVLDERTISQYTGGFLRYIGNALVDAPDVKPCIRAYEDRPNMYDKIMPRPSETVFQKGRFLGEIVLDGMAC